MIFHEQTLDNQLIFSFLKIKEKQLPNWYVQLVS